MTFYNTIEEAHAENAFRIHRPRTCFCCGEEIEKYAVVLYDAFPSKKGCASVPMHRDCAFAMAQRIILDAWPNRRGGYSMKVTGALGQRD
jgi:hypothetical protein